MTHSEAALRAQKILLQRLEALQRAGVESFAPIGESSGSPTAPSHDSPHHQESLLTETPDDAQAEGDASLKKTADQLAVLNREVAACTLCTELAESRTQTVFGVGNVDAELCFFGEAPGADEDRLGEPFVGRAGQLLTDMIEKGMGLRRSDVYILNVLKCRPPGNRNPSSEEVANCRHFFERQLELIQPNYICCLGSVAAQNLLNTKQTVGRMRGYFHQFRDMEVLVTYHPAYLLRNPSAKKETWKDLQILMHAMGLPVQKD